MPKEKKKSTWNDVLIEIVLVYFDLVQLSIRLIGMSIFFFLFYIFLTAYDLDFWQILAVFTLAVYWHTRENPPPQKIKYLNG